jgi:hypothetical protein
MNKNLEEFMIRWCLNNIIFIIGVENTIRIFMLGEGIWLDKLIQSMALCYISTTFKLKLPYGKLSSITA